MIVAGRYSFKRGREVIEANFGAELDEIRQIIAGVDAAACRTKTSAEQTMNGRVLYSPRALNRAFKDGFEARGWVTERIPCEYPTDFYVAGYNPATSLGGAFREMD
jgi:hypothetical protein